MKIIAAVIGMGIGEKHLKAIDGFLGSKVKIICERNKKKLKILRKKYPDKIVMGIFDKFKVGFKKTNKFSVFS